MATGFFDPNGDPCIELRIRGVSAPVAFPCVIDTGFTGFLSIPFEKAFPLGFILTGTTYVTLADGRSQGKFICLGFAELEGIERFGVILIEPQSEQILIGIKFIRQFGLRLLLDPVANVVELSPSSPTLPAATGSASPSEK